MSSSIRTCYISAPAGSNLDLLRKALYERHIDVLVPDDQSEGSEIQNRITSIISRADLVIGVLTTERRSSWVLFELGLAWAKNRPIMLISSPKNDFVPSNLQRFLVLRAGLRNTEAIEFALDQFLAAPLLVKRNDQPKRSAEVRPDPLFVQTCEDIIAAINSGEGRLLEQLLVKAFKQSGVDVVSEFESTDRSRADMAIWADRLSSLVGNPLLVEIKLRFRSSDDAKKAALALANQVTAAGTQWGLLLYGVSPPATGKGLNWLPPGVLATDIPSFLTNMQTKSFSDVVIDLRNQRVHGRNP